MEDDMELLRRALERYRITTKVQGPYHVEWNNGSVCIRSHCFFHWQIIHLNGTSSNLLAADQTGLMFMSKAVNLSSDMQMVLKMEGEDDVVIQGR